MTSACGRCLPAWSRPCAGPLSLHRAPARRPAAPQALFQGVPPSAVAFLSIQVRRSHVVEDALNQVGGWCGFDRGMKDGEAGRRGWHRQSGGVGQARPALARPANSWCTARAT